MSEGNLSGRKVGESSFLKEQDYQVGEVINSQLSYSGKIIRSINILIGGSDDKKYVLSINFDVSFLNQIQSLVSQLFNHPTQPEPKEL